MLRGRAFRSDRSVAAMPLHVVLAALLGILSAPVSGGEPRVAGIRDLVVIEPEGDPQGLSSPTVVHDRDGNLRVELPPTIHVHRMYYAGDRQYQGPIVKGGPTMIVAAHPRTGEQLYTRVTLPPGMPMISYSRSAITYHYRTARVRIRFPAGDLNAAVVDYHDGKGWKRTLSDARQKVADRRADRNREPSPTVRHLRESMQGGRQVVSGTVHLVDEQAASMIDRLKSLSQLVPGLSTLKGEAATSPPPAPLDQPLDDNPRLLPFRSKLEGTAP